MSQKDDSELAIRNAFSAFDKDETGYIGVKELKHVLKNFGEPLNENEIDAFLANFVEVGNNTIALKDIVRVLNFEPNFKGL